mgnify:CR=1 FL=1
MNQNDRQFITDTINKALNEEVPKIVKTVIHDEVPVMIKTALDASNREMKQFIVEHVSNEINDLAMITARQFERLERKMDEKFDLVDKRFDVVEKKIDYIGENYVKDKAHHELDKRVKKLELARV